MLIAATALGFSIWRDLRTSRSAERRFASIETSLRILTASVAPQMYKSIDDSLKLALSPSEADAAAGLKATTETIKQLSASNVPPDQAAAIRSGETLARVSLIHPNLGQVWESASQLISYRSYRRSGGNEDLCVNSFHNGSRDHGGDKNVDSLYGADYYNCTFVLDDEKSFKNSPVFARFEQRKQDYPRSLLAFTFQRVHIVYRGGNMIAAARYVFIDCTFEFKAPASVPPEADKTLFRGLIAADLSQPVAISSSGD